MGGGVGSLSVAAQHSITLSQYALCVTSITSESVDQVLSMLAALMNTISCLCNALYFPENFIISCLEAHSNPLREDVIIPHLSEAHKANCVAIRSRKYQK